MSEPATKSRFDSSGQPQAPIPATLSSVLRKVMREHSKTFRVCLPVRVEAVHSDYRVDVRPCFLETHGQQFAPTPMPLLPSVPVAMPHGAAFSVRYPLTVGDNGYVLIADRSLDAWLAGGGQPVDPVDSRLHDLTDAIFVPGLLTDGAATAAQDGSKDLVLKAGLATLRLQQGGTFVLGNGVAELLGQVQALAQKVQALALTVSASPTAPGKPVDPSMATVATAAGQIAVSVGALKGS